jgi:hypothetical protein
MVILKATTRDELSSYKTTSSGFTELCRNITDSFLLPSVSHLEAIGEKSLTGNTQSGHAVLLMHDLMTIRKMCHAIKHGHPQRILHMIKYWCPMFYAAGSYNYSNECMELLHNVVHDWPKDYAGVAFNGMLVNPTGKPGRFKETNIRVEHLNDKVKARGHGPNATPELLEKVTPALGHVHILTEQLYEELGVEQQNQVHSEVAQHKDVEILVKHLTKHKVFDFQADKLSKHAVADLYCSGCTRLAGKDGGHAKHLARHKLCLRTRHSPTHPQPFISTQMPTCTLPNDGLLRTVDSEKDWELEWAADNVQFSYNVTLASDELLELDLVDEVGSGSDED